MKFKLFVLKLLGMDGAPRMIPVGDHWIFVDMYQRTWRISYTGRYDYPFTITLLER